MSNFASAFYDTARLSIALLLAAGAWTVYKNYTNPLWRLNGPPSPSFIWGNVKELTAAPTAPGWIKQYGRAITHSMFFGRPRLMITDPKAVAHLLNHARDYPKHEGQRYALSRMVGPGVLVVEGDEHKRQRRVMNPAFGNSYVKELVPTFFDKSFQLRDILAQGCASSPEGYQSNSVNWLSNVALDIIGLAGFGYDFHALDANAGTNELQVAFSAISANGAGPLRMLQALVPIFRLLPSRNATILVGAQKTMDRIGSTLLSEAKALIALGDKVSTTGRDMFSLLVKANTSPDLPEHQRLSDKDVITQVPTFFVAGHETTATAITWMLYALTRKPEIQKKLREELLAVPTDTLSAEDLSALPYLDCVLRETLRLHAPVIFTQRVATKADILPLSEPIIDRSGEALDGIPVQAGDLVAISLLSMNTDTKLWGEDALEFKPERWEAPPTEISAIPGVWSNVMTFLGGPRACIGYRFSIVEAKAIVFTLLRAFGFELAVKHEDIVSFSSIVQRPYVKNEMAAGSQLPVIIRPLA
ncbi:cytochrome P450 [Cylindrobasidium torrendii FP15055 ss-10]|uniref:Cytochrome P450 n=1 Tax=Cylindrobasidium torrendii FP15055 ss-10 TaxID=1314674 RepID=A0A0D7AX81_9AGAR|nr:cytochrome P450 [Cylindrobasidium torrendii FP15055 ss-10]